MGWAGGSRLFNEVIDVIQPVVKNEKKRQEMYLQLIEAFTDEDWDTMDECFDRDPAYDAAYAEYRKEHNDCD